MDFRVNGGGTIAVARASWVAVKEPGRYHHGDLRRALIAEALAIIEHEGAEVLTLRTLASRLGVSPKAPYRHFEDKSALLAAVAEEGFHQLIASGRAALEESEGAAGIFVSGGIAYVRYALSYPRRYQLMFERLAGQCAPPQALLDVADALVERIALGVAAGQHTGDFRPGEPRLLAQTFWSALHGLSLLAIDGRLHCAAGEPPEAAVTRAVQMLLEGLQI